MIIVSIEFSETFRNTRISSKWGRNSTVKKETNSVEQKKSGAASWDCTENSVQNPVTAKVAPTSHVLERNESTGNSELGKSLQWQPRPRKWQLPLGCNTVAIGGKLGNKHKSTHGSLRWWPQTNERSTGNKSNTSPSWPSVTSRDVQPELFESADVATLPLLATLPNLFLLFSSFFLGTANSL